MLSSCLLLTHHSLVMSVNVGGGCDALGRVPGTGLNMKTRPLLMELVSWDKERQAALGGPAWLSVPRPKPVKQRLTDRGDHVRQPRQAGLCRGVAPGRGWHVRPGWLGRLAGALPGPISW